MKGIQNLNDLLTEEIRDLYSSEQQIEQAYPNWIEALHSDEVKKVLNTRLEDSRKRMKKLETIAEKLKVDPSGVKCKGTDGLIAEGDDFLKEAADDAVMDAGIVANAQRIEHYSIAGYGCAKTYADQLGLAEVHKTLHGIAQAAGSLDKQMTSLAERRLNMEAAGA